MASPDPMAMEPPTMQTNSFNRIGQPPGSPLIMSDFLLVVAVMQGASYEAVFL